MFARIIVITSLALFIAILAACGPGNRPEQATDAPTTDVSATYDYASLLDDLRAGNLTINPQYKGSQGIFSVPANILTINEAFVFVFEYADAATAEAEAAFISPDGEQISIPGRETGPGWSQATPHFFRCGRLIAIYAGDYPAVFLALEGVLGPQFAGGAAPLASTGYPQRSNLASAR